MTARTLSRSVLVLVVGLLLGGAPRMAAAQLDLSAQCVLPGCGQLDFFLTNVTSPNLPLNLTGLQLDLLNGWTFSSASFTGEDDFAPFGPFAAALSGSGATAFLDFEFWIDWFALDNSGSTGSVRMGVTAGPGDLAFAWSATDVAGDVYSGSFTSDPPGNVVPEPVTLVLLATGLAGVGIMRRRRIRGEPPE